jgi:thiamine biosynthesis lipoprotein
MPRTVGHVEHVMGTVVSFDVRIADDADESGVRSAISTAVAWLHRVDEVYSLYRDDSQLSRLGRGELRLADCDADVAQVLDLCAELTTETRGFFSARYSGRLDPTGVVKGWAVERASRLLLDAGFTAHCLNGGGDVQASGEPEPGRGWRIGIDHPLRPGVLAGVVEMRDAAVATSGIAQRGLHVVDPFTGRAVDALASVTVVGADLTRSDAYATAAVAMGMPAREWLESLDGYEAFAIASDGDTWRTSGFRFAAGDTPRR